jgi:hypothetical protein
VGGVAPPVADPPPDFCPTCAPPKRSA